ncbi:MAG: ribosome recycling factor [Coriobacteriales bacterium]|nr:ribosome recycling factor [Coriobacteriales bacterium]
MIEETYFEAEESMEKAINALASDYSRIRTGRASARMLDHIQVEYYGVPTPITQLAGVKVPEAHLLVVEPWDKSILRAMEKAIMASDLGITPSNDGFVIRLPFPAPTEERRRELVKQCKNMAETTRTAVRNARRDANAKLEKAKKASEISEDDMHRAQDEIQKLTDKFIAKVDETFKAKEAEVMEV